jgi:membrane protein
LVVASAFGPDDADIAYRIHDRVDIHGSAARSVEALFNDAGEVESAVTWVSIVILVLSATSFTRALQKMFQRAYKMELTGWRDGWRGLAWLAFFGAWITISSPVRGAFEDVGGLVFAIAVSTVLGFVLWLFTPRLLMGPIDWRGFAPGAIVSAVLGALLAVASGIYVPILLTWSADKYGLIGVAFSIQSWLLATSFVVVVGAVVGAVTSELFGDRLTQIWRRGAVRG